MQPNHLALRVISRTSPHVLSSTTPGEESFGCLLRVQRYDRTSSAQCWLLLVASTCNLTDNFTVLYFAKLHTRMSEQAC